MTRFSEKAIEVYKIALLSGDLDKMQRIIDELENPLDIAYSKFWVVWWGNMYQHYEFVLPTLLEIEEINQELGDALIDFVLNTFYVWYYARNNALSLDRDKAYQYMQKVEEGYARINPSDDFERTLVDSRYNYTKTRIVWGLEHNLDQALFHHRECVRIAIQSPVMPEYLSTMMTIPLATNLLYMAEFEEAEYLSRKFVDRFKKHRNPLIIFAYYNLIEIEGMRGNIQGAISICEEAIDVLVNIDIPFGVISKLDQKANLLFSIGDYDASRDCLEKSMHYRSQLTPTHFFMGKFNLFEYYHELYELTGDQHLLGECENLHDELIKLAANSNDQSVRDFAEYTRAMVLKRGNLRKKAESMNILEGIIHKYPLRWSFRLHLLDLLFHDLAMQEEEETISQIDELMSSFSELPTVKDPKSIGLYTRSQILFARYQFVVKKDPHKALDVLQQAFENLEGFNLDYMKNLIQLEQEKLEREITRWDNLDASLKQEIKTSEMQEYIKKALTMMKQ